MVILFIIYIALRVKVRYPVGILNIIFGNMEVVMFQQDVEETEGEDKAVKPGQTPTGIISSSNSLLVFSASASSLNNTFVNGDKALTEEVENETEMPERLEMLASKGDADAQFQLGLYYLRNEDIQKEEDVTKYHTTAFTWLQLAALQDHVKAQFYVGWCYEEGAVIAKNELLAVGWYRKAAKQGYAKAQHNLALCYANGTGILRDEYEGFAWYEEAAKQGLALAQHSLGVCYEYGNGVDEDKILAMKWYRKAAKQGDVVALKELVRLERQCTRERRKSS